MKSTIILHSGFLFLHVSIASAYVCTSSFGGCPDLETINRPLSELYRLQPIFRNILINEEQPNADNICFTLGQLAAPDNFVLYSSTTYMDGSYAVIAVVVSQSTISNGVFQSSSSNGPLNNYNLGPVGCNTDFHYVCYQCNGPLNSAEGLSFGYTNFTDACLSRAEDLLSSQNIPVTSVQVLPQQLRPNCFKPQNCLAISPFTDYYCRSQTPAGYPFMSVGYVS